MFDDFFKRDTRPSIPTRVPAVIATVGTVLASFLAFETEHTGVVTFVQRDLGLPIPSVTP
jgi:hypothetical protein